MYFTRKLMVIVAILIMGVCSGFATGHAAPLRATSSITISPTSAACSESGGELNFSVTANPSSFVPAAVQYHSIVTSHVNLNVGLSTYVYGPITFNKHITWTAASSYFWEQSTSYSFTLKVMLTAKPGVLDYSILELTCSKQDGVILNYSNN